MPVRLGTTTILSINQIHSLTEYVSQLLKDSRVNPAAHNHKAIQLACFSNSIPTVQLVLKGTILTPQVNDRW